MAYISYKRRRNGYYAQLQESYRDPKTKKVKTRYLKSLGPAGTANLAGHVGVKLIFDKEARKMAFGPFSELMAEKDARDAKREAEAGAPVTIGDLTVGKEWTQEMLDGEAMS